MIVGGLIIIFTGFTIVDPIIGFMIGLIILRGAWRVVREAVDILLEATPTESDGSLQELGTDSRVGSNRPRYLVDIGAGGLTQRGYRVD